MSQLLPHYADRRDLISLKCVCKEADRNIDIFKLLRERNEVNYKGILRCALETPQGCEKMICLLRKYEGLVDFANGYVIRMVVKYRLEEYYGKIPLRNANILVMGEFMNIPELAAYEGNTDILAYSRRDIKSRMLTLAAINGDNDTIVFLRDMKPDLVCPPDAIMEAVRLGHHDTLKLLYDLFPNVVIPHGFHSMLCATAAGYGHIETFKLLLWLYPNWDCGALAITTAARGGHNEIILLIYDKFPQLECSQSAIQIAACNGHNDTIILLCRLYPKIKCTNAILINAAQGGHCDTIELLCWMFPSMECPPEVFDHAAYFGREEAIKKFKAIFPNVECSSRAFEIAAMLGKNKMIILLRSLFPNVACTDEAYTQAMIHGHEDTVKLLDFIFPRVTYIPVSEWDPMGNYFIPNTNSSQSKSNFT